MKRREIKIRNQPGVSKVQVFCEKTNLWRDSGKFRALRRIARDGRSIKEQAVFDSFEDAKAFRCGSLKKGQTQSVHQNSQENSGMTFGVLVERWKLFHYLMIEDSTKQTYEKLLPTLDSLKPLPVSSINSQVIGDLAVFWATKFPRTWRRKSFVKEWQLLRVILNFYREDIPEGANFVVPSFKKAKKITELVPTVEGEVAHLSAEETVAFLSGLRNERYLTYYYVALFQYFFALRIGEVCGLCWDSINLEKGLVTIRRNVTWDVRSWVPHLKEYTKTKRVRHLPIPPPLHELLEGLKSQKNGELVFASDDGVPLNRKTIATAYNRVLKRLGFNHVSGTHFLRRTAATLANDETRDFDAVSRFLGHSSLRVTRKYVGEMDSQKQRISSALNGVLEHAAGGPVPQCPALRLIK